jgi:hypothetical protein
LEVNIPTLVIINERNGYDDDEMRDRSPTKKLRIKSNRELSNTRTLSRYHPGLSGFHGDERNCPHENIDIPDYQVEGQVGPIRGCSTRRVKNSTKLWSVELKSSSATPGCHGFPCEILELDVVYKMMTLIQENMERLARRVFGAQNGTQDPNALSMLKLWNKLLPALAVHLSKMFLKCFIVTNAFDILSALRLSNKHLQIV